MSNVKCQMSNVENRDRKIKIGVVGAGGYAGATLIQILLGHEQAEIKWLMSEDAHKGKNICELYPHLLGRIDLTIKTLADMDKVLDQVDLVFLALPHGIAMDYVPKIIEAGKKIVDLGADFRFHDDKVFESWYNMEHRAKKYNAEAVFGLPEYFRKEIKNARLVGNPGCYPTASILAIAPLAKEGIIETNNIIVDAKSGVSGAGRGVSLKTLYCERNESFEAYNVTGHRHMGEIEYQVIRISGDQGSQVTFVPHLTPMSRGILATVYAKLKKNVVAKLALPAIYKKYYKDEKFVRIREDVLPCTKYVAGTNYCDISVKINERTSQVIVLSAIDNLVKGAAGQAVQNMNIMYQIEEGTGLTSLALYP